MTHPSPNMANWTKGKFGNSYARTDGVMVEMASFGNYAWRIRRQMPRGGAQYLSGDKGIKGFKTPEAAIIAADRAWPL